MQTAEPAEEADDSLTLLFLCCHPALGPVSQVALTLRAVGGLTTAEIARALGAAESAMAQRISRAKQQIRHAGGRFRPPPMEAYDERLSASAGALPIFNEVYSVHGSLTDRLRNEAIGCPDATRLAPTTEWRGYWLMLLTQRRPAR